MAQEVAEFDVKQAVLFNGGFGPREIEELAEALSGGYAVHSLLREATHELKTREDQSPASMVRLGVCLYLLGDYRGALQAFQKGDGGALALFYSGKTQFAIRNFDAAIECYNGAEKAGYSKDDCALGRVEALRVSSRADAALRILDDLFGPVEQTAEYLYQRGATIAKVGGNPDEVVALYERAVHVDGNHAGALFGLALENDRRGNDDQAFDLYKRSASRFPPHVGALMNLGLMYEDRERFDRAVQCYERILYDDPHNSQAELFLKDARASGNMQYDEEAQRHRDRLSQVYNIPVTDYELSVRSRNCLEKMGIFTLGDLCRCTEQELLGSKNFGETSLIEIREILASKGLRLGQLAAEREQPEPFDASELSADEQALLTRPISELNLSVRARKCMIRLGINTIGELVRKTGDQLLECKNFGVTSLNEVREKLAVHNLKLHGD